MRCLLVVIAVALVGCGTRAKTEPSKTAPYAAAHRRQVCLLAGALPTEFKTTEIGRIKATKRTYGSTEQLFPVMAEEARRIGADAIINLQADIRFKSPLPWRITSPTGDGQAVTVASEKPLDCLAVGGRLY
jgi:hypothetical protein